MAEIYGRDAKRQAAQMAALAGVQERFGSDSGG